MCIENEKKPRNSCCPEGHKKPFEVEGGVVPVEKVGGVVIVGAVLATVTILGTMIAILVPAGLVHRVFALDDNLVAGFERCLAEIAGLFYGPIPEAHVLTSVADDVFATEKPIADSWYDKLHDEPDKQHE